MARMHSRGKGLSKSTLPYRRKSPTWLKITPKEVEEQVVKLARKGLTPSRIGSTLRDSNGIGKVKFVTGKKIVRILKSNGLGSEIPEDLYHLIKKAVTIKKHLEKSKKDKDAKYRMILVESKIHRLEVYYKRAKVLEPNWTYDSANSDKIVT